VVCSEPGLLLSASCVNIVVFDKTGTLTSDTQSMTMVVGYDGGDDNSGIRREGGSNRRRQHGSNKILYDQQHPMANVVLAGCHFLVSIAGSSTSKLIGDPLNAAPFEHSNWMFDPIQNTASAPTSTTPKGTTATEDDDDNSSTSGLVAKTLWQIKSFLFDPNRSQTSAPVLFIHGDNAYRLLKVVQGSPDTMLPFLTTTPTAITTKMMMIMVMIMMVRLLLLKLERPSLNVGMAIRFNPSNRKGCV